jgi:hypothetical protein
MSLIDQLRQAVDAYQAAHSAVVTLRERGAPAADARGAEDWAYRQLLVFCTRHGLGARGLEAPPPPELVWRDERGWSDEVVAWQRWMVKAETLLLGSTPPTPGAARRSPRRPARLKVDLRRRRITLDDTTYEIPSEAALRWVRVLAKHRGQWVSSADLGKGGYDKDLLTNRPDHLRRFLPGPINSLIQSKRGTGSRMVF